MVLETLSPGAPTNVRDLQSESPKRKEGAFDPETEITSKNWQRIMDELSSKKDMSEEKWWEYLPPVLIVDPEKRDELGTVIGRYLWDLDAMLERSSDWDAFTRNPGPTLDREEIYSIQRIVNPQMAGPGLVDRDWLLHRADEAFSSGTGTVSQLYQFKLIFPDLDTSILQNEWANSQLERVNGIEDYFKTAAKLRIIMPGFNLNPNKNQWSQARNKLDQARFQETMLQFVQLASSMKIVAAKSVQVDENGIHLVMPEKPSFEASQTPLLPDLRRF